MWKPDEAVQWLERPYDTWEMVECLSPSGLGTVRVRVDGMTVGREFSSPMFEWKYDISLSETRDTSEDWDYCGICAVGPDVYHRCYTCEARIQHSQAYSCEACWNRDSAVPDRRECA
jgi:hypothetical protein